MRALFGGSCTSVSAVVVGGVQVWSHISICGPPQLSDRSGQWTLTLKGPGRSFIVQVSFKTPGLWVSSYVGRFTSTGLG